MERIPFDVIVTHILPRVVSRQTLPCLALVCQRWRDALANPAIWTRYLHNQFCWVCECLTINETLAPDWSTAAIVSVLHKYWHVVPSVGAFKKALTVRSLVEMYTKNTGTSKSASGVKIRPRIAVQGFQWITLNMSDHLSAHDQVILQVGRLVGELFNVGFKEGKHARQQINIARCYKSADIYHVCHVIAMAGDLGDNFAGKDCLIQRGNQNGPIISYRGEIR
jgi:hypothetical protein